MGREEEEKKKKKKKKPTANQRPFDIVNDNDSNFRLDPESDNCIAANQQAWQKDQGGDWFAKSDIPGCCVGACEPTHYLGGSAAKGHTGNPQYPEGMEKDMVGWVK